MNNFRTLLGFEFRKAFGKKAYWIALIAMIAILLVNELTPVVLGNYKNNVQTEKSVSGTVINNEFIDEIKSSDDYKKYGEIESFLKYSTGQTDFSNLDEKTVYSTRTEIIERGMTDLGLSEDDKQYWRNQDSKNKKPFTYYYSEMYRSFFEIAGYVNFMILIICAAGLSGIFADEKARGTDQIIFGTRLGKKQLFTAKFIVGIIMGIVTAAILLGTEFAVCSVLYGTAGANTLIQLFIPYCMMNMTIGKAVLCMSVLFVLEGIILAVIAMMISVLTMNHSATLAFMVMYMFAAMFNIPSGMGIISKIWSMAPGTRVGSWLFDEYRLVNMLVIKLNMVQATPVLWAAIFIIMLCIMKYAYNRYEVKSR